ncbi:MAG: PQQ-dependent sugar dehydrogenase, partial [Gammaproteobacteria bacterium]
MKSGSRPGSAILRTQTTLWRETAKNVSLGMLLLALAWSSSSWTRAATLPPGFTEEAVLGPWNEVVGLTFEFEQQTAGGRMYVWERGGQVWIIENGITQSAPLIDLHEEVGGWRDFGLLGFALHPNFRQNGYLYLSYVVDHHHLTKFGTPAYHPDTNEYFMATIGRITRYTARASDGFRSVDPASRKVLLGKSITNGFPITYQSHGVGSLVFGTDGSLLAVCGDGGSYSSTDLGSAPETYFTQALAEGIIRPKENIGALRAQLVDSLSGKIVRIDPETGDGLPSNPFYEPASPRSARSRVWCLGLRNPYRVTLRPGTGNHSQADANPGA